MVELTQLNSAGDLSPSDTLIVLRANANALLVATTAQLEALPGFQALSAVAFASALARIAALEGAHGAANAGDYVVGSLQPGVAAAAMVLLVHPLPHAVALPVGLAGTFAAALHPATAAASYALGFLRGSVLTALGTFNFAAGSAQGAITAAATLPVLQAGDTVVLTGPITPDTTLADVGFSILCAKE